MDVVDFGETDRVFRIIEAGVAIAGAIVVFAAAVETGYLSPPTQIKQAIQPLGRALRRWAGRSAK